MDAAQGSDVSMPSPVSGGAPMADAGSGILLASGGGGGGRVRSAGYSEDDDEPRSPIRTAAGSGARASATTQTQCKPGMKCYRGGTTVGSGQQFFSPPQSMGGRVTHINGVPVEQMGGGSIVTGTPMATTVTDGGPQAPSLGDFQGIYHAAQRAPTAAGRAAIERGIPHSLAMSAEQRANEIVATNKTTLDRAYASEQQRLQAQLADSAVEIQMKTELTQGIRESTALGNFETRASLKKAALESGAGDPASLANSLMRLEAAGVPGVDSEGKPMKGDERPVSPERAEEIEREAYTVYALHGFIGSIEVARGAQGLTAQGQPIPARNAGESTEDYLARTKQGVDEVYGPTLFDATNRIITALKTSDEWQSGNFANVAMRLDSLVANDLRSALVELYKESRPAPLVLTDAARQRYEESAVMAAQHQASAIIDFMTTEAEKEFQATGGAAPQDTWKNTNWGRVREAYGADERDRPVDSNDTMPAVPDYMGAF
jgi:hypothetical protein